MLGILMVTSVLLASDPRDEARKALSDSAPRAEAREALLWSRPTVQPLKELPPEELPPPKVVEPTPAKKEAPKTVSYRSVTKIENGRRVTYLYAVTSDPSDPFDNSNQRAPVTPTTPAFGTRNANGCWWNGVRWVCPKEQNQVR